MSVLNYPDETCLICKDNTWYFRNGKWACGICHPPGEQDTIKMRIIKGTYLLNKKRWELTFGEFEETIGRLRDLWAQLKKIDCLYLDGPNKLKKCVPAYHNEPGLECFTCRNDYWWLAEVER